MGQELLAPPNVKGWDGEQKWINSNSWSKRREFAVTVANLSSETPFNPHSSRGNRARPISTDPNEWSTRWPRSAAGDLEQRSPPRMAELLVRPTKAPTRSISAKIKVSAQERTRLVLSAMLGLPEYHAF